MGQHDLRKSRSVQQQRGQTALPPGRSRSGAATTASASGATRFSVCSSWFDVRVVYARVASCAVEEAPDLLSMWFPPRGIDIALEVNGARIAPSEEACIALRRDRRHAGAEEVTFVSTDNIRTSGALAFEIHHRHELLVSGSLKQSAMSPSGAADSSSCCEGGLCPGPGIRKLGWRMECSCEAGILKCSFVRVGQHSLLRSSSSGSASSSATSMEVCVVGRFIGSPVILTQTVQLNARRTRLRCMVLDVIPEDEECCSAATPTTMKTCFGGGGGGGVSRDCFVTDQQQQLAEAAEVSAASAVKSRRERREDRNGDEIVDDDDDDEEEQLRKLYESGDYEENGEVSWFNAGVRVGVGIGLGMCLGVGLGVGLMVRTYNATARSFRRGLL